MTHNISSVSVVLATYNGQTHLAEQLESLASQSKTPFELIVSDDRSTDSTQAVVAAFAKRAPFPVVQHQNLDRLGYGANFLNACTLASGSVVAFCDQDDVWEPGKLEIATTALQSTGADLYIHAASAVDDAGTQVGEFSQGITKKRVQPSLSLNPWKAYYGFSMVFRRELLDVLSIEQRGPHLFEHDTPLSHDLWIYFLAFSVGSIYLDPKPLARYRQHAANETPHIIGGGLRSWTTNLGRSVDPLLSREQIATHRAHLMASLATRNHGVSAHRAEAAARYWTRVADLEAGRIALYSARPWRRPVRLAQLVTDGAYSSFDRGGLGARLMLKDLLAGMCGIRRKL